MIEPRGGQTSLSADQQKLVEEHLWLADALARELHWLAPRTVDGDLVQTAREGLIKAALHYRPETGKPLSAYARRWIRGAIFNAVDRQTPGATRPHRAAADAVDNLDVDEEGRADPAEQPLDQAAAAMCICSVSLRWAAGSRDEKSERLGFALERMPAEDRRLLLGHLVEGVSWEELAQEASISVRTAQRRVKDRIALLLAWLRGG